MNTMMNELALLNVRTWKSRLSPRETYTQRAPKRIVSETWNRFEIPTAKQRNMQITPVLSSQY